METIVHNLRQGGERTPPLAGHRIEGVTLRWPRHIVHPSPSTFRRQIRGQTIRDAARRGKYLVFPLDRGTLLIHLRMSGDLQLTPADAPRDRYERTVFHLRGKWELRLNDSRKFAQVHLVDDPASVLSKLGPEPLDPGFTANAFGQMLAKHRRAIKPLLLDQAFVAGLGNIYADEALHRAGLHPLRRADRLNQGEVNALRQGIRAALRQGLRHNGASLDWVYRGGGYQNHFRVYQRHGKPCPKCGTGIQRMVIAQRGTHFCPRCQPESDR